MTTSHSSPLVSNARKSFYGSNPLPHAPDPGSSRYAARLPADVPPEEEIIFKWHFAKGLLRPRMSAYELGTFLIEHMRAILQLRLLSAQPRIEAEFAAMLTLFLITPHEAIDRVLPWVQSVDRRSAECEEDDIITLSLFAKRVQERTLKTFY